ncbi:uncharacterized protein CLUP02_11183 [Colletotrichum lupini]|uniref:Uncharacterized protein n=1 Tax=Colletotrichum lupini TaxID=145971 RepID=A0A9Q8SY60_9PEZI|nr:uncharacterized protein CLUP02_11183 [Colletotrichum lupini]UQC85684.1 hypothetical protein CLUP02_11183 [Colletotrichum lupini]
MAWAVKIGIWIFHSIDLLPTIQSHRFQARQFPSPCPDCPEAFYIQSKIVNSSYSQYSNTMKRAIIASSVDASLPSQQSFWSLNFGAVSFSAQSITHPSIHPHGHAATVGEGRTGVFSVSASVKMLLGLSSPFNLAKQERQGKGPCSPGARSPNSGHQDETPKF